MDHPFEVGKTYRNRQGVYEVVSITGPRMVIRYDDGLLLQTRVDIQARIWSNIQLDARAEREQARVSAAHALRRRGGQRELDFQGLSDHDFKAGVGGTSWRARTNLGGRLAQRLTDTTPYFFQSYAIFRRAEIHIAVPTFYGTKTKWQEAKLVFRLDAEQARYGFYIEKNSGPMDATWHWPNMVAALVRDEALHGEIEGAMRQHRLRWDFYVWADGGLIAQVEPGDEGLTWRWEDHDQSEHLAWSGFLERLAAIESEKWCDLFLSAVLPKEEAIAARGRLVDTVADALRALLPLYEASTRQGRFAAPAT